MEDYIKLLNVFLDKVISMQTWRFVAILLMIVLVALCWRLDVIILALKA